MDYHTEQRVAGAVFVVSIAREDGTVCLDANTQTARVPVPDLRGDGRVTLRIARLDLGAGRYHVNVGIFEGRWQHAYDYHTDVYPLTVEGTPAHKGVLTPPCEWSIAEQIGTPEGGGDGVLGSRAGSSHAGP